MHMIDVPRLKPLYWIGSALKDVRSFPEDVKDGIGYALEIAQRGGKSDKAKPLKGFQGASVLEIVEDHASEFTSETPCATRSVGSRREIEKRKARLAAWLIDA